MSTGIMIIGPSGSGKTTLGKIVAQKLGYLYFDVDDYIWKQNTDSPYTQMYTREEKISRLNTDIAPYEHFVMAGSMSSFHYAFDDMFKMMVFLYVEPDIRIQRVHKRAIERFGRRVLEGGDMYESHMKFYLCKEPTNFRLSDCKGRALRKVQEKDSARVKGEAP